MQILEKRNNIPYRRTKLL